MKGHRGFGSAVQALLRYLRSAVSDGAELPGQTADAVSCPLSLEGGAQSYCACATDAPCNGPEHSAQRACVNA